MGRRTALYELHLALGARMIDFGGWDLPLHYGSQIEEHHAVRHAAGLFDVSHMGIVDVRGAGARAFLQRLLANDVAKLTRRGRALYGCMLNAAGGVIDDLIVYLLDDGTTYRLVVNGATRDGDLAWIRNQAEGSGLEIAERTDLGLIAVQGPRAREAVAALLPPAQAQAALAIEPFNALAAGRWLIARTGYTGEDGFEVMLPAAESPGLWRELNARGAISCGLGARDTLRLEAGLNLYGHDMDQSTNPLESALAWTVAMEPPGRDFIGRAALEAIRARGIERRLVGLVLEERGVLRAEQRVVVPASAPGAKAGEGRITSGTFSPTLQRSIALARIPVAAPEEVLVDVRGKLLPARIVKPPFVRKVNA